MRIDKTRSVAGLLISACVVIAGCSSTTTAADSSFAGTPSNAGRATEGSGDPGGSSPVGSAGVSAGGGGVADPGTSNSTVTPQAGRLTAGVWDDNLNYDFFKQYLQQNGTAAGASIFSATEQDAAHARAMQPRGART